MERWKTRGELEKINLKLGLSNLSPGAMLNNNFISSSKSGSNLINNNNNKNDFNNSPNPSRSSVKYRSKSLSSKSFS